LDRSTRKPDRGEEKKEEGKKTLADLKESKAGKKSHTERQDGKTQSGIQDFKARGQFVYL